VIKCISYLKSYASQNGFSGYDTINVVTDVVEKGNVSPAPWCQVKFKT